MQEVDRTRRVAALVKQELSRLIARQLNDSRINGVTVTDVTVSRDLKQSTVYFSSMQADVDIHELERLLNHSAGYLRRLLSQMLAMRTTPALLFKYDTAIDRGIEMTRLINRLNKNHG